MDGPADAAGQTAFMLYLVAAAAVAEAEARAAQSEAKAAVAQAEAKVALVRIASSNAMALFWQGTLDARNVMEGAQNKARDLLPPKLQQPRASRAKVFEMAFREGQRPGASAELQEFVACAKRAMPDDVDAPKFGSHMSRLYSRLSHKVHSTLEPYQTGKATLQIPYSADGDRGSPLNRKDAHLLACLAALINVAYELVDVSKGWGSMGELSGGFPSHPPQARPRHRSTTAR